MAKTPARRTTAAKTRRDPPATFVSPEAAEPATPTPELEGSTVQVGWDLAAPGSADKSVMTMVENGIVILGADVEMVDLDGLYPDDRNTRIHPPAQADAVEAAMRLYGWTIPLLIRPDGGLIAGHLRWQVASDRLKLKRGPAIVARDWSEEMIRAYIIWDNRSSDMGSWDLPTLKLELDALTAGGFELESIGFTSGDLMTLFLPREVGENDPGREWRGMPAFEQTDKTAFRSIPVHFASQEDVDAFAKLLGQGITDKTKSLWYPPAEIETYADKRYIDGQAKAPTE